MDDKPQFADNSGPVTISVAMFADDSEHSSALCDDNKQIAKETWTHNGGFVTPNSRADYRFITSAAMQYGMEVSLNVSQYSIDSCL